MLVRTINSGLRKVPVWTLYILLPLPAIVAVYLAISGQLGAEPIKELEHELGSVALKLLIISLAITPLLKFAKINLVKFRRIIGLAAFFYVFVHLLVWLVLDVQVISHIWADIVKRPYVTVGFAGFLLMVPLAVTSNNWSVRKLGPTWRTIHRLTYAAAILGGIHYIMLVRGFQLEPLIHMAVILAFLAARFPQWWKEWVRRSS